MSAPDDPYPDVLTAVAQARIAGNDEAASRLVASIPFTPQPKLTERWPSISVMAMVYGRDRWQCVYCGERVILVPALRLLSRLYASQIPYHSNWKADATHPVFAARGATLDHIKPIAGGGSPVDVDNLATSCWGCNRRKGDMTITDLNWTIRKPTDPNWRGLSDLYQPLWKVAGQPKVGDDEMSWMRAVAKISYPTGRDS